MGFTVRKEDTINQCEILTKKLGIKTKTGVIDHIVERHLPLVRVLKEANNTITKLKNELFEIKTVVKKNTQAVKSFAKMCDKINGEGQMAESELITLDQITGKIYNIRGIKVMIDSDLAALQEVEKGTKSSSQKTP